MTKEVGVLRTETDRFDLFNDGRTIGANKRNYIIKTVQDTIASPITQELLRLGEAYGYYGHGNRELAGKSLLTEQTVVVIKGVPTVIDNVPSNRCISISCSDDGVVEHTEDIVSTPTGIIVDSMIESKMGGWSWAMSGYELGKGSFARNFAGVDYVLNPNYLSLNHQTMMNESISDRNDHISDRLLSAGFDENSVNSIIGVGDNTYTNTHVQQLESQVLMLEGMLKEQSKFEADYQRQNAIHTANTTMLYESLSRLPVFISDDVKRALCRLETDEDRDKVELMLESLYKMDVSNLPIGINKKTFKIKDQRKVPVNSISYQKRRLFK